MSCHYLLIQYLAFEADIFSGYPFSPLKTDMYTLLLRETIPEMHLPHRLLVQELCVKPKSNNKQNKIVNKGSVLLSVDFTIHAFNSI